ncbi:MAG TPA: ATP-binding protein, partial [Bacteroidia bacterium]
SFEFVATKEPAFVKADKDQLLRILNNLINNAVQAIQTSTRGRITLTILKEDANFRVSVADNGVGIDDAVKQKIFQPNFSTKSYGTGLGLAMCKRMIEQHGGTIWFESEQGRGCTFYFTIPY